MMMTTLLLFQAGGKRDEGREDLWWHRMLWLHYGGKDNVLSPSEVDGLAPGEGQRRQPDQ